MSPTSGNMPGGSDPLNAAGAAAATAPAGFSPAAPPLEPRLSEKELTLQNTLQNAGHPRSSSAAARGAMTQRRASYSRSSTDSGLIESNADGEPISPRLKWDEANLYLAEQEKSATMKINEPKTPYAKHYDPAEDPDEFDDDIPTLDAQDIVVDELDRARQPPSRANRESEIPGLDIGEPEAALPQMQANGAYAGEEMHRSDSNGRDKQVQVDPRARDDEEVGLSREEKEKHRRFEEARKRHYEMKDVKDLLG